MRTTSFRVHWGEATRLIICAPRILDVTRRVGICRCMNGDVVTLSSHDLGVSRREIGERFRPLGSAFSARLGQNLFLER